MKRVAENNPDLETFCATCQAEFFDQQKQYAIANNLDPPKELSERGVKQRAVDNLLRPLIRQLPDSVDDATFGSLAASGGCDTQRGFAGTRKTELVRPDCLYVKRDEKARLIGYVNRETDEDSHEADGYEPSCTVARVCSIAAYMDKLAAEEAKTGGYEPAALLGYHVHFNPDACDGVNMVLTKRVEVVAQRINFFLEMSLDAVRAKVAKTAVPRVEAFYYHTKGKRHLDAYAGATDAMLFLGNCLDASGASGAASSSSGVSEEAMDEDYEDYEGDE